LICVLAKTLDLLGGETMNSQPTFVEGPATFNQVARCAFVAKNPNVLPNLITAVTVSGALNEEKLVSAAKALVRRHEALRTTFPLVNETRVQRVWSAVEVSVSIHDLTEITPEAQSGEIQAILQNRFTTAYDLENDLLVSFFLFRQASDRWLLAAVLDHIIIDRWSLSIFWEDLWTLYDDSSGGALNGISEPAARLIEYATWQRSRLTSDVLSSLERFWEETFRDLPAPLAWKNGCERPAKFTYRSVAINWALSVAETSALRRLAAAQSVSLFMLLNAALALVVGKYGDKRDFLIQTIVADRNERRFERLIGFLANVLILRIHSQGQVGLRQAVRGSKNNVLDAFNHGELPTGTMIKLLGPALDGKYAYRSQIAHYHESFPNLDRSINSNLRISPVEIDCSGGKGSWTYDIVLETAEVDGRISGVFWYNEDIFSRKSAHMFVDEMYKILRAP
jgi:surfactin family lipopeptide synthetase A